MGLPLKPLALLALAREFQAISSERAVLAVLGGGELAAALRRELGRGEGADASALAATWQTPAGPATALVWLQAGPLDAASEAELRAANAAKVPIVAVIVASAAPAGADAGAGIRLPYVLAGDHLRIGAGEGFPLDAIGEALGRRAGEKASGIAARLPVLRDGICAGLIKHASKRNAMVGSVIPIPGADLPVLAVTQLRLVLRIAHAYGEPVDTTRLPELLGVVVGGLGLRGVARTLAGSLGPGWLVKGAVAYGGTRAMGEAAVRWFQHRADGAAGPAPEPPAGAA